MQSDTGRFISSVNFYDAFWPGLIFLHILQDKLKSWWHAQEEVISSKIMLVAGLRVILLA